MTADCPIAHDANTLPWRSLMPVHVDDLVRIGRDGDGGYVIPERVLGCTEWLISLGIECEWSFEKAFLERSEKCRLIGVDGTTGGLLHLRKALTSARDLAVRLGRGNRASAKAAADTLRKSLPAAFAFPWFWNRPGRTFVQQLIGIAPSSPSVTSWADLRRSWPRDARIFVKMDIEGAEYDVLPEVIGAGDQIVGFAFEFHDLQSRWRAFSNVMRLLMDEYAIVHVHGNNYRELIDGTDIPSVLEVSFVRKSLLSSDELNSVTMRTYPVAGLDFANDPLRPDFALFRSFSGKSANDFAP